MKEFELSKKKKKKSLHQCSGCFISAHKKWKPSFVPWGQISPPKLKAIHSISLYRSDSGKYHLFYKIALFYGETIVSESFMPLIDSRSDRQETGRLRGIDMQLKSTGGFKLGPATMRNITSVYGVPAQPIGLE